MTPVLLDQRTLVKAGATVSIAMFAVFLCGYYIGQQKAVTGGGMELNQTIALALPRPAHADTEAYEPQLPLSQAPGADIDVDSPEDAVSENSHAAGDILSRDTETGVDAAIRQTTDIIETRNTERAAEQADRQLQLASLTTGPGVLDTGSEAGVNGNADAESRPGAAAQQHDAGAEPAHASGIIDTAGAEDARYTIQVGAFADTDNALRRKAELESLQLSAYINEYTNKQDQLRYNVRFGYFNSKSSALAALNIFENSLSGSGYVTRIRRTISQ